MYSYSGIGSIERTLNSPVKHNIILTILGESYANVLLVFRYVLKELIQTERDYVKSLGEVVEVRIEILSAT